MKWKAILILVSISLFNCAMLRQEQQSNIYYDVDLKQLDANSVKSPGGFDNVAPDATKIVSASLASIKYNLL